MESAIPLILLFALVLVVAASSSIGARLGKRKGNTAWGASLGILGPLGWIITLLLPNRRYPNYTVPEHRQDTRISNMCKKCGSSNPLLATECAECGTPIGKRQRR
jgi:ribosomal protein L40E